MQNYKPRSVLEYGLYAAGIHPLDEPEGDLLPFYVKLNLAAQVTAGLVSYYRHQDVKWAVVHGLMGPFYLTYLGTKALSLEEARGLEQLFQR
jgi:hypothetical protein